ncbi:phospho-sugar mutase [Aneurinibacillus sp. BA2021]|nr:phospho-sugar mutase [Aneurinibacillus sp. BA2021]
MEWRQEAERWVSHPRLPEDMREELLALAAYPEKLEDCFYRPLAFGTGGLRGEMGPGTNRMNVFTVRKVSAGLARYIIAQGTEAKQRGVAIAYDVRHRSHVFALEAALTLNQYGIPAYLFDDIRPTPLLSFAVRHLGAYAGIVITASHNPPEYNGYKVYGSDGGQLPPKEADAVTAYVNGITDELSIDVMEERAAREAGLLRMIGTELDDAYLETICALSPNRALVKQMGDQLHIVFTPLHGTSNQLVRRGLAALGCTKVAVVAEQEQPDPEFSTVVSPNPEEHAAFKLAMEYGRRLNADVLFGTDPDADRVGVVVKNTDGDYIVLTGNQTGALLLHYLLTQRQAQGTLPANGAVMKTIVTSEIGRAIAAAFGIETIDTLTGFKFIGEKIQEFEETGQYTFVFGYEESYGYLAGDAVRDKDAVQACLLVAEAAAYYKARGMTMYEGLLDIFNTYGYYAEDLVSLTLKGRAGVEKIASMMEAFRAEPLTAAGGRSVVAVEDYQAGTRTWLQDGKTERLSLPTVPVLKYLLQEGGWFCLRPSGTEPKIKFYFGVQAASMKEAQAALQQVKADVMKKLECGL